MEGLLLKYDGGIFNSWLPYYFILHEDTLNQLDKKEGKLVGSVHLKVAKISGVSKDPLQIQIFNGTSDILLKAISIKEKVDWQNALINHQSKTMDGRYDYFKRQTSEMSSLSKQGKAFHHEVDDASEISSKQLSQKDWNDTLNLAFCTKIFKPDSPFLTRLGKVWEKEAELEENISLIVPEAQRTKNPMIIDYTDKIRSNCQSLKSNITQCVDEMEETRREIFRVAKLMIQLREQMFTQNGNGPLAGSQVSQYEVLSPKHYLPHNYNLNQGSPHPYRQQSSQINKESPFEVRQNQFSPAEVHENQRQIVQEQSNNYHYQHAHQYQPQLNYSNNNNQIQEMIVPDNFMQKSQLRVSQGSSHQYNQKVNNNQLFEEEKIEDNYPSHHHQQTNHQQIAVKIPIQIQYDGPCKIIGFGGIPINYTMKMRETLPFMTPEKQSFSIWAILKDCIGKDLSKITMPIWLNEPISMLQKTSEVMHYHNVMEKAIDTINDDPKRLGLIAIYILSQYSDVYGRNRKPFNPILGETYEIIQPNYRYFSEQVSHHPPISAFHSEGKGYYHFGNTNVSNHFRGSSLEFRVIGIQHLYLTDTNEHLIIKRPDNSANNLIMGTLYVDVHGKMSVQNLTKNLKCEINVQRQGWTTKVPHKLEGKVWDSNGDLVYEISGRWSEYMTIKNVDTQVIEEVWRADPKDLNSNRYYGFPTFTMNTNYADEIMLQGLPPTDCRRRMDQRWMEEGKYDQAAAEKHRLEEKQRGIRKYREKNQIPYKPIYFDEVEDEISGNLTYKYKNTYWEKRKLIDWKDSQDLF